MELKEEILTLVEQYYKLHHLKPSYQEGDIISYAGRVFDQKELRFLVDASLDFWLTAGEYTKTFEKKLGEYLNTKYCYFVNSGSSANLLAFMALTSPLLKERAILPGDEIITVACGFPTTVTPILQYGAVPVFVDVSIPQYNIDVNQLELAYSPKSKGVMIAHTLGNPFNISAVKEFCDKHQLWLIEDNCDALGSEYTMNGCTKKTGTWGDIGTSSFYPPHHLTTGEGGAVYTNNPLLGKICLSMRDWGRDCVCASGQDNLCGHRFDQQYGQLPLGYDHKYVYSHFGYNLKATDLQAAVGVAQLEKLNDFSKQRAENFLYLHKHLQDYQDSLVLPEPCINASPSWFGFLITCKDTVSRNDIVQYLEEKNIQTRMLFAGNLIKHPCFDTIRGNDHKYRVIGALENTNTIMERSFWIGVSPIMTQEKLNYMIKQIKNYLS